MSWLYIIANKITNRYYIGSAKNLDRRLKQHKAGKVRTSRILETFDLVYKEEYKSIYEARMTEKKLKSYKSKKYIMWLINSKGL